MKKIIFAAAFFCFAAAGSAAGVAAETFPASPESSATTGGASDRPSGSAAVPSEWQFALSAFSVGVVVLAFLAAGRKK